MLKIEASTIVVVEAGFQSSTTVIKAQYFDNRLHRPSLSVNCGGL